MKSISYSLVFVQFSALGYLLLSEPFWANQTWLLAVELLGILLGVWAVYLVMQQSKIRVVPDVHPQANLVNSGIYRIVRHPMYLAILLTVIPLLISYYSIMRLAVFAILLVNLILKIRYEEKLLSSHFANYQEVHAGTKRLLPFIW